MMNDKKENLLKDESSKIKMNKKPQERIFLEWSNISYKIIKNNTKKKKIEVKEEFQESGESSNIKIPNEASNSSDQSSSDNYTILKNICGFALPQEILAIMGPSGCGKTSLLNIIAHRQLPTDKNHLITRKVKANNIEMDQSNFGKICAYVMQDDILLDCLTPRESLTFCAKLKLKKSDDKIRNRVERLIFQFGLEKCADSQIGSIDSKGISGGERKRTSIAYELISNPPIVIIDEPTTGMDSFTSLIIIKYLKQLALGGKTIICTIHQPSSEIFQYIDRLILLKDGHLVYQGQAQLSFKYLEAIGLPIPDFCNPFDHFIEILSDHKISHIQLNDYYNKLCQEEVRDEGVTYHEQYKSVEIYTIKLNLRQVNWFVEFSLLLNRAFINYIRNKTLFYTRILNVIFNSFIIMGFYWNIGADNKTDQLYQNFVGFFFNNVNQLFINGIYTAIFIIPTLKSVLKREYSAKLYRVSTFYVSIAINLLLNSVIYAFIYSISSYFTIQLAPNNPWSALSQFTLFFLLNFFMFTLGQYLGLLIGGTFPEKITFVITPLLFILFLLGSGFYRGNDSIPVFIKWLLYISPYKYLLELIMNNFKDFNDITKQIPSQMKYDFGNAICIPVLIGTMATILLLGFMGIKYFAAKF